MNSKRIRYVLAAALVLLGGAFITGCSTDSPTAPATGGEDPGTGVGGGAWNISIVADPDDLVIEEGQPIPTSLVTIRVTDQAGQLAPTNTTIIVSSSLGTLTGGALAGNVASLTDGTAQLVYTPGPITGTGSVRAQLESSVAQRAITIRLPDEVPPGPSTPAIFSLTPTTGPIEGGTEVVITGSGFEPPVQVLFPIAGTDVEAQVLQSSSTTITARTPDPRPFANDLNEISSAPRVVNLATGNSSPTGGPSFFYGTAIRITAVSPTTVDPAGGDLVTIFGQGFDEPVTVSFGNTAQAVISVSPTQIVVRATATEIANCSAAGGGQVSVVNVESGASAQGPSVNYFVPEVSIFGVSPNSGTANGGTSVTISGANFESPVRVKFGGAASSNPTVSGGGTSISAVTPPAGALDEESCDDNGDGTQGSRFIDTAVDVDVENLATGCTDTFQGGFSYVPTDTSCRGDVGPPVATPQCSDGVDNDGDTLIDFPADPGCSDGADDDESDA